MSTKIISRIHCCIIIRQRLGNRKTYSNNRSAFANKRSPGAEISCF